MAEGFYKTDFGDAYSRDGQVWLKSPAGIAAFDPLQVDAKLRSGVYVPATRDEALAEASRIAHSTLGEQAKTAVEAFGAGAFDVATAPATILPKLGAAAIGAQDPTEFLSGRHLIENAASLGGSAAEALGAKQTGEAVGAQYGANARARAQANPGVAFVGGVLGQAAGGGLMTGGLGGLGAGATEALGSGVGAALASKTALGALEGAAYGGAQANEDSYIQDRALTSEQMLTHLGAGAFIGGLVGFGSEGLAQGLKRLRPSRVPAPDAVAPPVDTKPAIPANDAAIAEAATAGPLQGEPAAANLASSWRTLAEKANKKLATAQSALTGADRETLEKFSPLNPKNWDKTKDSPYDLWHNRVGILEGATQDITADVQRLTEKAQAVGREVWDAPAKTELVAKNLAADGFVPGLEDAKYLRSGMREESLSSLRKAYTDVDATEAQRIAAGEVATRGGNSPLKPVEVDVEENGTMRLIDGRHRMTAAKEAGATKIRAVVRQLDAEENVVSEHVELLPIASADRTTNALKASRTMADELRGEIRAAAEAAGGESGTGRYLQDLEDWSTIEHAAARGDLAETYSSFDRLKRTMQKKIDVVGRTLGNETNPFLLDQKRVITNQLEATQEKLRGFLEDESVWGKQGLAQRETNAQTSNWLRYKRFFDQNFLTQTGREYGGFGGGPILEADRNKIGAYIQNLGKKTGSLQDKVFREHLDATEAFTDAIGRNYEPGSRSAAALAEVKHAAAAIRERLAKADTTVKTANQIDEIAQAERGGISAVGAIGGGWLGGGPLGALAGAAFTVASRPGQLIRQAAAIKQIAANVDLQVGKSLASFFSRATGKVQAVIGPAKTAVKTAGRVRQAGATGALTSFLGHHPTMDAAYRARVAETLRANADHGAAIRARVHDMGDLPDLTPKLSQAIIATATNAAGYLQSRIPSGLISPTVFQPTRRAPVDRADVDKFARIWATVNSPLSALKDLEHGRLTFDQVEALKTVYPKLYAQVQSSALEMLRDLDLKGVRVPYRDKLQLDVLLDLNGAGEATMDPAFALRVDGLRQQQEQGFAAAQEQSQHVVPMKAPEASKTTLQRLEGQ